MIQVTYNGVDITNDVAINRCFHDMFASGRSDTLNMRFIDSERKWDAWAPSIGDEIRIDYGTISTGAMFITSAIPQNGLYDLEAMSAPASGFEVQNKAWQKMRLTQIGKDIAERNGLDFASYGVEDELYSYIQQSESDFAFLHKRARLEGCAFLVYNKRLVLYSERYMEAQDPIEALEVGYDGDYKFTDNRAELYDSCLVESGLYKGEFSIDNGASRIYKPLNIGPVNSSAEAERFAKNLLRDVNKNCCRGYVRSRILPGYAAASMVELNNVRAPSWDGAVFLHHIRNDYAKGKSKLFFRRPLEGY